MHQGVELLCVPVEPFPKVFPEEMRLLNWSSVCTWCVAVLFIIATFGVNLVHQWMPAQRKYIYKGILLGPRKNKALSFVKSWMELKVVLIEVSWGTESNCYMFCSHVNV